MPSRIEYAKFSPQGVHTLLATSKYVHGSGLDHKLLALVFLRVSQINGCAYCVEMHSNEAIAAGDTQQRVNVVAGWREAGEMYSAAERAALAWAECLTRLADNGAADEHSRDLAYDELRKYFDEKQTVDLSIAIGSINSWNRIAVGFKSSPPIARA